MVIAIFAILKSGCQYVPLDGGVVSDIALHPIFEDTASSFVLCLARYVERVHQHASLVSTVDDACRAEEQQNLSLRPDMTDVTEIDGAYVIYISGMAAVFSKLSD